MRVVFIGPFAFYPKGTVPVRLLPLAKALQRNGHEVVILLPPYDNLVESGRRFRVDGVDFFNVWVPRSRLPLGYLYVAGALVWKALRLRPDVVHVFKPKGYSGLAGMFWFALRFLRLTRVPVVVDSDDWEGYGGFADFFLERGVYSKVMTDFFDFQERWLLKRADAVTIASRTLELRARVLRGESVRDAIFYVPNGPSEIPSQFGSADRSIAEVKESLGVEKNRVVLLYTRFFEYDVEEMLDVLGRVVSEMGDVRLLVVGKGEFGEEKHLLGVAEERGLLRHIIYVGWVKPEELPAYIDAGDVAVYPFKDTLLNRSKCPGKLVQLMSFGKAIVADGVGQIAEYIENGESGVLVKPGETDEFAERVVELLENEGLREMLGENAKKRIWELFGWQKLAKTVETAYRFVTK